MMRWLTALGLLPLLLLTGCQFEGINMEQVEQSVYRVAVIQWERDKDGKILDRGEKTEPITGFGTGFLVSGNNVIVTNRHVVENRLDPSRERDKKKLEEYKGESSIFIVYKYEGKVQLVNASVVGTPNKDQDIAILRVNGSLPGKPLPLATYPFKRIERSRGETGDDVKSDVWSIEAGSEVRAIGYPYIVDRIVKYADFRKDPSNYLVATKTDGRVSRSLITNDNDPIKRAETIQHQAALAGGSSGSPLLDLCGTVIGINSFGASGTTFGFAYYSAHIAKQLEFNGITPVTTKDPCNLPKVWRWMPIALPGVAGLIAIMALMLAMRRPAVRAAMTRTFSGNRPAMPDSMPQPRGKPMNDMTRSNQRPTITTPPAKADAAATKQVLMGGALSLMPALGGAAKQVSRDILNGKGAIVGRHPDCDISIVDETVSSRHARLKLDPSGQLQVEDLGSSNGTWVDGGRVSTAKLFNGQTVKFGNIAYKVDLPGSPAAMPIAATVMAPMPSQSWRLKGREESGAAIDFLLSPKTGSNGGAAVTEWSIGRNSAAVDFVINDPSVSSRHAKVRFTPGRGLEIADAGSSNGSRLDGQKIGSDFVPLPDGRSVTLGKVTLSVSVAR